MRKDSDDAELAPQWARVRVRLREEFGEIEYGRWLKPLTLLGLEQSEIRIAAPNRFLRDWVGSHYLDRIQALWAAENKAVRTILIVVQASETAPRSAAMAPRNGSEAGAHAAMRPAARATAEDAPAAGEEENGSGSPLVPRLVFDNFVIGKPNEFAFAASRRVAEEPRVPFNPLFLYGGVGLGKTHLMHAIAWEIRKRNPARRVIYLSAEGFMQRMVRAIRFKDTDKFKEQFRSAEVLLIDDLQFICGKEATQEEFFHTFNALVDRGSQIVLSADKSPIDLEGLDERVRSRLSWGLVADIHPTTFELRLGILQANAERMGVDVPSKVLEFLAHKITSNVRELEGAMQRIVAYAQLVGRQISVEMTQEVMHDVLRVSERRVTIEEIQKRVAEHFSIRLSDMHSPRRARAVARPRQVAMYLAKQLTTRSLPEIGRKFGGRDHTTVMHAVRKVEELRAKDHTLAEDIDILRRMLES